jgi:hypothetical protein
MKKELKEFWEIKANRGTLERVVQTLGKKPTEKDLIDFAIEHKCVGLPIEVNKKYIIYM